MKKIRPVITTLFLSLVLLFATVVAPLMTVGFASADQASCEASGGQWIDRAEGPTLDNSYCSCPADKTLIADRCESPSEGASSGSSSFEPAEIDCEVQPMTRDNCGIINYLVIAINFLSAVAIMAIVASVMFAGYQYMSAGDNPGQVAAAKKRIIWALVALGLFTFGYGLLNFLVPGGVL